MTKIDDEFSDARHRSVLLDLNGSYILSSWDAVVLKLSPPPQLPHSVKIYRVEAGGTLVSPDFNLMVVVVGSLCNLAPRHESPPEEVQVVEKTNYL